MKGSFTIVTDSREKKPLVFPETIVMLDDTQLPTKKKTRRIAIKQEIDTITTGDYCLVEHPDIILVERKNSLGELAKNCLTPNGRRKFVAECERLREECYFPHVIVEGTIDLLVRKWNRTDVSPWAAVDAIQRLCLSYGITLLLLPSSNIGHRRALGEYVAHLLINGALTHGNR